MKKNKKNKVMIPGSDETTHESFGMISASRFSSNIDHTMFGSPVKHGTGISLRISQGVRRRHLSRYWYDTTRLPIVEVEMSELQFAQFISSMNRGEGTPCTIRHTDKKTMETCPSEDEPTLFRKEFRKSTRQLGRRLRKGIERTKELLDKPRLTKADKAELLSVLESAKAHIEHNLPFVKDQFDSSLEKASEEAKKSIEAHAISVGLKASGKSLKDMLPEGED